MMNAYKWAYTRHPMACQPALDWLTNHPDWTLDDAWRECKRGDWMILALAQQPLTPELQVALARAITRIVTRAVETHALHCGDPAVDTWARRWLSGEDRTTAAAAARDAARAEWDAARAVTRAEEAKAVAAVAEEEARERWYAAAVAEEEARERWYAAAVAAAEAAWAAETRARTAAEVATWADAADVADEHARQADDLRAEIPEWPEVTL